MMHKTNNKDFPFFEEVATAMKGKLNEMGITKHAFCHINNLNRKTCDSILNGNNTGTVITYLDYLDLVGLKLKVVDKNEKD